MLLCGCLVEPGPTTAPSPGSEKAQGGLFLPVARFVDTLTLSLGPHLTSVNSVSPPIHFYLPPLLSGLYSQSLSPFLSPQFYLSTGCGDVLIHKTTILPDFIVLRIPQSSLFNTTINWAAFGLQYSLSNLFSEYTLV